MTSHHESLLADLRSYAPERESYATLFVDRLLTGAIQVGSSDVHLLPTPAGLEVRWRLDGVLQRLGYFSRGAASDVIARLKVMASLLTYHSETPQEGRIRNSVDATEVRVSTFPSLHGERAVIRLFGRGGKFLHLDELGLPTDVEQSLTNMLRETAGAILITGPAGSGKTTTAYACIRTLLKNAEGIRSVVSLEDPIEVPIDGVSQSQIHPPAGFDFPTGLRSLMRQDPEVILVGEIRDAATAETVFQAALTGHMVITTFHSGSSVGAICRLRDMGIEAYLIRTGILGIVNQRLVRRLCACSVRAQLDRPLGLPVEKSMAPVGCATCLSTGYTGRLPLAEILDLPSEQFWANVGEDTDARYLEELAVRRGMKTRWQRACSLVEDGWTSPAEVRRVLGFQE